VDYKEIGRVFYRDGFRLANSHLEPGVSPANLRKAIHGLYEAVDGLLEAFLKRSLAEGKPAECRKGCAWCCHQTVLAVTHELLLLREHVQQNFSVEKQAIFTDRAREKSLLTLNKTLEAQLKLRSPCPFLENGSCAVYDVRPMACRIYLSASAGACMKEHNEPDNRDHFPDLFEFPLQAGRMLNEGFVACLKQLGLASVEIPVEQGYSSIVTLGQTIDSWIG
jgi:Fe-S-cluster containining protein